MLNQLLFDLALWLDAQQWSTDLHESYYVYNWVESTHVLTLMIFLGMLVVIDLRMLGYVFKDVPVVSPTFFTMIFSSWIANMHIFFNFKYVR